ncbi:MAG: protoporphyrinogen oxidase [Actinobacteria bacterium]|nr:MAG: protoporphyrinogen oxidase [Actinomycetota bacterium]
MPEARVIVIGAGIAGLATAWHLQQRGVDAVVLEAADRAGGKVRTSELDGVPLDVGADTFLGRMPWAVDLCREVGLGDDLVAPATSRAWLWSGGHLRPLPEGLALGVPLKPLALARSGVISPAGLARAGLDVVLPQIKPRADPSVADVIGGRLGQEVLDRLVDPLIGGINAGRSDRLSMAAVAPDLFAAHRLHRSLILGLRTERHLGFGARFWSPKRSESVRITTKNARETEEDTPLFLGLRGGMERLTSTLAAKLDVSLSTSAAAVARSESGRLAVTVRDGPPIDADTVVLPSCAAVVRRRPMHSTRCGTRRSPSPHSPTGPPTSSTRSTAAGSSCHASMDVCSRRARGSARNGLQSAPAALCSCAVRPAATATSASASWTTLSSSTACTTKSSRLCACAPRPSNPSSPGGPTPSRNTTSATWAGSTPLSGPWRENSPA